jgi:DNA-binding response OmpR family regulator
MDGHTLGRKVREADKNLPIIIVAAERKKSRVVEALIARADA